MGEVHVDGFHFGGDVLGVAFHDDCACGGVELFEVAGELSALVILLPVAGDYFAQRSGGFVWCSFLAAAEASASVVFLSCHY